MATEAAPAVAHGYPEVRVFVQDESRLGLLPIVRHRITACGVQPLLRAGYCFESFYLYGAVEPPTGESFFLELPELNTAGFQIFVNEFSRTFPSSLNLLLLDNGAFHKAKALHLADNLALIFFPAYAPELNPIERLWRDLKDELARDPPDTLKDLSAEMAQILNRYSADELRSLTGFSYLRAAIASANVYSL